MAKVISNHQVDGRLRVLRLLRAEKGFDLFDRGRVRFAGRRFFIRSETRPGVVHYVEADPEAPFGYRCGCEDYTKRGAYIGYCKHVACILMWARLFPCFECGRPQHRPICFECERRQAAQLAAEPPDDLGDWLFGEPGR
jgi:hypothetical protein